MSNSSGSETEEKKYQCRAETCKKVFNDRSNRDRHEKRFQHSPPVRRKSILKPIYDAENKEYKCPSPECKLKSKYLGNVQRHIKTGCDVLQRNKSAKAKNKECPHCKMTFTQKSNRDRHVKNVHSNDILKPVYSISSEIDDATTDVSNENEIMNVSFRSDDGDVFERNLLAIDLETPIFEVLSSTMREPHRIDITFNDTHAVAGPSTATDSFICNDIISEEDSTGNEIIESSVATVDSSNQFAAISSLQKSSIVEDNFTETPNFVTELLERAQNRDLEYEKLFKDKVLNKLKCDIKSRGQKKSTATFLFDCFGDMLLDDKFLQWLARKLEMPRYRLKSIVNNFKNEWKVRNTCSDTVHELIYDSWLKEENSIPSTDRRNLRDVVRVKKSNFFTGEYKHLKHFLKRDTNLSEESSILKKTNKVKIYIKGQRMIYTKPMDELHRDFLKENPGIKCSRSTFIKFKPFYIESPSEREKESCLRDKCQNAHLYLKGINTYRKHENIPVCKSVTEYLNFQKSVQDDVLLQKHPEKTSEKTVNYHVFEIKVESYVKMGVKKEYSRTTRVDKNEPVCDIYAKLVSIGDKYLRHRSHVDNIKSVLPKIRDYFSGTYIEMDFSENLALKTKCEVQAAHCSGKQYALHCSIIEKPERSYLYHLSDDTGHDAFFVDEVLTMIFEKYDIRNETIIIKSDNAPTQYKNKWAFKLYQQLADEYNVRIIRLYGAAGHGKGLVDAMSSFGVKAILKRDIVTSNAWFADSEGLCNHLRLRGDKRMSYEVVDPVRVDRKRMEKIPRKIPDCTIMHLFDYRPANKSVLCREYLCDCVKCMDFDFKECMREKSSVESVATTATVDQEVDTEEDENVLGNDYFLDQENVDEGRKVYEFVEVPSYVALVSYNTTEPIYIIKVHEKGVAKEEMKDDFGHTMYMGELYLRGNYLKLEKTRSRTKKHFSVIEGNVLCDPSEVFEVFVDINDDLTMNKEAYMALLTQAS